MSACRSPRMRCRSSNIALTLWIIAVLAHQPVLWTAKRSSRLRRFFLWLAAVTAGAVAYFGLDHMERPTSALHLSRITLDLRELRAEPHTKEVGHHGVYSSDCVRSACRHDGGGGAPAG